jgi:hypothetical protein
MGFSCSVLLMWEAGSWGRGQFVNPEEGERLPLEATTEQRLMKTQQAEKTSMFVLVNWKLRDLLNRL